MKITKTELRKIIKEELLKEEMSVEVGLDFLERMRDLLRKGDLEMLENHLTMLIMDAE
tara:strand:+ start:2652 stop:2825 length:174 start_codon:yes stop_codon:yes gene_type:complete